MIVQGRKYRFRQRPAQRIAIWLLAALFALLYPVQAIAATNGTDVAVGQTITYQFEETIWVTNSGNATSQRVRLEVPLLAEVSSPMQELVKASYNIEPQEVQTLPNGNRVGVFYIDSIRPGERVPIRQTYNVRLVDATAPADATIHLSADELAKYLAPAPKIESDAPQIQAVARELTPNGRPRTSADAEETARAAYDYVRSHLKYNMKATSINKGALAGLQAGEGICEEYASLFVAILRAAGVPARVVNGFASDSKPLSEYNGPTGLKGRRHQWAEFYVEGEGWIPVDPTLANNKRELFGELPTGFYLVQNYGDSPVKARYAGGQIGGTFEHRVAVGK